MARGGRRGGTKGGAYPNRSDLRSGPLPVTAPTGLPYGDRAKLVAAQRQIPMGTPAPPAAAPGATPPPQGPVPGSLPGLSAPTQRPDEPVTHGLPMGPGAGPEVLSPNLAPDPLTQAASALDALGTKADAETAHLRDVIHVALANRAAP